MDAWACQRHEETTMPTVREEVVDALLEAYSQSERAGVALSTLDLRFLPPPTAVERVVARERRRGERITAGAVVSHG